MPSHEQCGGPSDEPAVPTDVCQPRLARPSRHVGVAAAGLGLAAELSPLCSAEQPTPRPRQPRPSTQRQTLLGREESNARNSEPMFRNPLPHLLTRPCPFE